MALTQAQLAEYLKKQSQATVGTGAATSSDSYKFLRDSSGLIYQVSAADFGSGKPVSASIVTSPELLRGIYNGGWQNILEIGKSGLPSNVTLSDILAGDEPQLRESIPEGTAFETQTYKENPGEAPNIYGAGYNTRESRDLTQTTNSAERASRLPGESISDFTSRLSLGSTGGIVSTSASARMKELQKMIGTPPAPLDLFTTADKGRLDVARQERNAIDAELASILNERLAIDEEMQKFGINAGKGTTEAGRIGAVSEAQRNVNERLQVLNRRELVLETKLANRNNVISELMQNQKLDYAAAVDAYNTKFSQAMQLYSIFEREEERAYERAEREEEKEYQRRIEKEERQKADAKEVRLNAQANLEVLANSYQAQIEAGQITSLSSKQRRQLEELETQAGIPKGATMGVLGTLKPGEEKLWSGIDDFGDFQYIYQDASGKIGIRTAKGAFGVSVGGDYTDTEERKLEQAGLSNADRQSQLDYLYGDQGDINDEEFTLAEEFANQFRGSDAELKKILLRDSENLSATDINSIIGARDRKNVKSISTSNARSVAKALMKKVFERKLVWSRKEELSIARSKAMKLLSEASKIKGVGELTEADKKLIKSMFSKIEYNDIR